MYTHTEIKNIVIKENGRPKQISSKIYTKDVIDWIMNNIKGESTLQGKLWCIAYDLHEVPKCNGLLCDEYVSYHNKFKEGFRKFCGNPKCSSNHHETRERYKKTSNKNWGVDNPLKSKEIRGLIEDKMELKYGSKFALQSNQCKEKYKLTSNKNWGVDNPLKAKEVRDKCTSTLVRNIGYEYPAQSFEIMKKIMKNRKCRTIQYNDKLYYQGSYEKLFLDEMSKLGFISLIENGLTFKYRHLSKEHLYVSDFFIPKRNEIIEIKSKWTYNKRGMDTLLENKNLAKKECVINANYNFTFLIGKSQITNYVKNFVNG